MRRPGETADEQRARERTDATLAEWEHAYVNDTDKLCCAHCGGPLDEPSRGLIDDSGRPFCGEECMYIVNP